MNPFPGSSRMFDRVSWGSPDSSLFFHLDHCASISIVFPLYIGVRDLPFSLPFWGRWSGGAAVEIFSFISLSSFFFLGRDVASGNSSSLFFTDSSGLSLVMIFISSAPMVSAVVLTFFNLSHSLYGNRTSFFNRAHCVL